MRPAEPPRPKVGFTLLVARLVARLVAWLVVRLVALLVARLVAWLLGWLVAWLICGLWVDLWICVHCKEMDNPPLLVGFKSLARACPIRRQACPSSEEEARRQAYGHKGITQQTSRVHGVGQV